MKKLICLLAISLVSVASYSQALPNSEKPFIEVNGVAEKEISPDIIHIAIQLTERYDGKEKITIEKQESELRSYLRGIGMPDKDLYLSDANSGYVRVKFRTKDVMTKKEYTLIVHSAEDVGKVFQGLDKLDIDDANIVKLDHTKMSEYRKEVKIMAIKAAKEKALYLLEAIGESAGKPLEIREVEYQPVYAMANYKAESSLSYNSEDKFASFETMEFKRMKVQTNIYIKYEIK